MKYKILWIEYHICDNEGDEEMWIKLLKDVNGKSCGDVWGDGAYEFECSDTFVADNIEEAKIIASEYECGQEGVFEVIDENKNRVFNEGDL